MFDAIRIVESHFGISLKRVSNGEYRSLNGCPFCGDSGKGDRSDRFRVFLDESPRWWCRQCGERGFVDALEKRDKLTPEEKRLRRIESEQRRLTREVEEQARRLTALEQMARCTDHLRYHQQVARALGYWFGEGMTQATIDIYLLGWCTECPTYHESASYTIPITGYDGELVNIRHRLASPNGKGKYRPHRKGLGSSLFNAPILKRPLERVIITEGEKKALVAQQSGFDTVGVCGQRNFSRQWLKWFQSIPVVFVALDPDAAESAERLAGIIGGKARVVDLPAKLDDMIVQHGASSSDIEGFLRIARPI